MSVKHRKLIHSLRRVQGKAFRDTDGRQDAIQKNKELQYIGKKGKPSKMYTRDINRISDHFMG